MNIGNPGEYTILELAEAVVRATGSRSQIVFEALPVDDPQVRQPDITRARQLLGWEPEVGLDDGLRRTIQSLGREPAVASSSGSRAAALVAVVLAAPPRRPRATCNSGSSTTRRSSTATDGVYKQLNGLGVRRSASTSGGAGRPGWAWRGGSPRTR